MATVRLPEPATQVALNVDNLDVDLDGAQVLAHQYIYDNAADNWDRVRGAGGAMAVDTELAAAILAADNMANPTVPQVLAHLMLLDGATWDRAPGSTADGLLVNLGTNNDVDTELPAAAVLTDDYVTPTVPAVGAFGMMYDGFTWDMVRGTAADGLLVDTELGAAVGISDDFVTPDAPAVAAFGLMYDGGTWDMVRGTAEDGLLVNLGTNNDVTTELPAAVVLGDGDGNPTTPTVGAALMGWNTATWDRLVSSIANGLEVDVTRAAAAASEYVDDADWTDNTSSHLLVGGLYQSALQTVTDGDVAPFQLDVNGRIIVSPSTALDVSAATVTVDSELPAAAALGDGDGNPTTPIVGAALMGWNTATWDRLVSTIANGLEVDVTRVIPGTGATNLGKVIDGVVGAVDVGVALLGQHGSSATHLTTDEGDYDIVRLSDFGAIQSAPEQHFILDSLNAATGWAAFNSDTLNLATTLKHVLGTNALTFDKVNGAANTIFAAIDKTISSVDLGTVSPHDLIQTSCYIPDLTNVAYVFIRLGTDDTNYNEWRVPDTVLTAATFEILLFNIGDADYAGITGNGWNPSAITYICIGVAFDAETDALAGIVFDELSFHTNQHTSAELNAEVSSSVSSANINLHKVGGSATDKGAGNVSNGSQRVVLATDDVNASAIKTAVELLDNAVAVLGTATYTEAATSGLVMAAVRNDVLAALADTDNELAPLQVDADGALYVTGTVEHGTADDGAPMKVGGRAQEPEAQPEEVADNDRVDALFDRNGYLRVRGDFLPQYAAINAGAIGDNGIIGAQPAGKRIAVWSLFVVSDGTVDVRFEDGAGGTALTGQVPLEAFLGYTWPAGGLVPLFVGSAAQTFNMELSAAVQVHGGVSFTVIDD